MRWRSLSQLLLIIGCLTVLSTALRADDEPGPIEIVEANLERPADFREDVLPILQAKCLACHSASNTEGGLVLETAASIRKGGDSGPAVVAGKPDESLLALSAGRRGDPSAMPPIPNDANAQPLTPQELALLTLWISEGAKDSTMSNRSIDWQPLAGEIDAVYSLALDPGERIVAAGRANRIHLYDIVRQRELMRLGDPAISSEAAAGPIAHRDVVSSLGFSPDGQWLASGGYRIVKLWQRSNPLEGRREVQPPPGPLALSADGRWLAAGLADGQVRVWDRASGEDGTAWKAHEAAVAAVLLSADGARLVSASGTELKLWDVATQAAAGALVMPSPVRALHLLPDGSAVASGHEDGIVRIWTMEQLAAPSDPAATEPAAASKELPGHTGPVNGLSWATAEGPRLVSAGEDGTLREWDLEAGTEARQIAHGSPVLAVTATTDGTRIASAGGDGIVRVWDATGNKIAEMSGDPRPAAGLVHAQDEQKVAQSRKGIADAAVTQGEKDTKEREESLTKAQEQVTAAEKTVAEAGPKVEAAQKVVDEATASLAEMPEDEARKKAKTDAEAALAKEQEALKKAEDAVVSAKRGVELSEKSLAAVKAELEVRKQTQTAEAANVESATAAVTAAQEVVNATPAVAVRGLAFAADGSWLAAADEAGRIVQWHVDSQTALDVFDAEGDAAITSLTVTPDNRLIDAVANGHVDTWNGEPTFTLAGHLGPLAADGLDLSDSPIEDRVLAIDFSPDSKLIAIGSGIPSRSGQLQIWDVAGRTLVREIADAHSDTVFDVAFSHDGTQLASGAADKFAKVFDVTSGELVRSFEGHTGHVLGVAWKADGSALATGGADNAIKIWTTATGEQQRTISSHQKPVNSLAFVGVEEKLASCAGDKAVLLHTISNGSNYRKLDGATDFLHAVVVNRDETRVVAGCEDGIVRVWNGTDGALLMSFPTQQ